MTGTITRKTPFAAVIRPIPQPVLIGLILALCALCAWQWHREAGLRSLVSGQARELADLQAERDELVARTKAADAEILRLTGALGELRATSVAAADHEEALAANAEMREAVAQQNALVTAQDEAIKRANASIEEANATIEKLTAERDELVEKVNEVTALYNELAGSG